MDLIKPTGAFDPRAFCSRKLWQMVSMPEEESVSADQLEQAVAELAARRRYLVELRELGKLQGEETSP